MLSFFTSVEIVFTRWLFTVGRLLSFKKCTDCTMKVIVVLLGVFALGGWANAGPSDWLRGPITPKLSSLPVSSCDPTVGLLCIPNACDKNSCSLIPDAKCIADRCGCEARFFKWNQQDKTFQDYSRMCHVSNTVANVQRFIERAEQNDEVKGTSTSTDPKVLVDLFRSFNSLIVEIMLDMARYISDVVKTDPTAKNVTKLRKVLQTIQALQRSARVDEGEDLVEKSIFSKVKDLIKKFVNDEDVNSLVGSKEMEDIKRKYIDGEVSERAIRRIIHRVIRRVLDEDAASVEPKMALRDDKVTEKSIFSKVWNVVKKVLDEDVSPSSDMEANDEQDEDIDERIPSWLKKGFKLAGKVVGSLLDEHGEFSDEIASGKVAISDEKVRENLNVEARKLSTILKKGLKWVAPLLLG